MKCIKNHTTGEIKRLNNDEAKHLVAYGWVYVAKEEWKKAKHGPIGKPHRLPSPEAMRRRA